MSNELTFGEIVSVLSKLEGLDIVLIGGQAVAFWVERYIDRLPELLEHLPFTSKDIDFCGDRSVVRECAIRVGGKLYLPTLDDATPNSGVVTFLDGAGDEHAIDFLSARRGSGG